ncbi:4,5-dihydroxyphthalate decarboxylase [Nocardia miyunensis]|uniref:4,5-dihydroxyphthalate decarboxylase n=1 Tax=Nocardia miyunensis TaxID=282684 RepID=UPI00083286EF|nr:4,5-dihydroxyphthalate decarboxylase [Nocardia miyunensis]
MTKQTLTIGCYRYDTTSALFDGGVEVDDAEIVMRTTPTLPEIFERAVRKDEFDFAELGLTFYLRLLEDGLPYIALPIFPNRVFRHSCVFVNAHSGITHPADLTGRTIGEFGTYGQDSGVWAKGILMDEYGFEPAANRWVVGGLEYPSAPFDFIPHPHPSSVEVAPAPLDSTLNAMLDAGEIDALFSANVPQCALDGSPNVNRLFPDFEPLERDYHRRTGIFPIMHTIVVRRGLLETRPELVHKVYDAFCRAKTEAAERYRRNRRLYQVQTMVPWMNALIERNEAQFGPDAWPYGIAANRTTLDTYLRYHHEQGLSPSRPRIEDVFAPQFFDSDPVSRG